MAFIEKCVCDVAQLIRLSSQLEVDSNSRATYNLSILVPPYSGEYIELKWNVKKKNPNCFEVINLHDIRTFLLISPG